MVMILANNLAKVEIMIKGAELSSKLNSIGVVNDFGKKSEGKQDLTEIIDLAIPYINGRFLTFIPSTAYVKSSESFSLYVALVDDGGVGISGKTITLTGSDNSVYSAITNNNGIATFTISSISEDVTFIASYEDLTSITTVELCIFIDYAVQDRHNHNYFNQQPSRVTIDELSNCKYFHAVANTGANVYIGGTSSWSDFDVGDSWEIIYDVLEISGTIRFGSYNGTSDKYITSSTLGIQGKTNFQLKFVCDDGIIKAYVDDVLITSTDYTNTGHSYVYIYLYNTAFIKAKNIRIKSL